MVHGIPQWGKHGSSVKLNKAKRYIEYLVGYK